MSRGARITPRRRAWHARPVDWDDVRHFLALARCGSVRAAGASLGVSHSTVARRVEALEARVSARLFDRSRDGYQLTEVGHEMLPQAERIETEMNALERTLHGRDERLAGRVSLTCCDAYVAAFLAEELRPYCEEHPGIELHFDIDSRPFDLTKREADLAVRILPCGKSPPEPLIAARLAPMILANYVSEAHRASRSPDVNGSSPRWLSFEPRRDHRPLIAASSYPDVPPWGAFSSIQALATGAAAGLGIVMLPSYAGDTHPGLERLARPDLTHVADLWLLSHPDLRTNARLRAARSAITGAFEAHAARFDPRDGAS